MPGEVDKLQVKIESDAQQALKNIDHLIERLRELARMTGTVGYAMKRIGEGFNSFKTEGDKTNKTTNKITYNFRTIVKNTENMGQAMRKTADDVGTVGSAFNGLYNVCRSINSFFSKLHTITSAVGKVFRVITAPIRLVINLFGKVISVIRPVVNAFRSFVRSVASKAISAGLSVIASTLRLIGNAAKYAMTGLFALAKSGFGAITGAVRGAVSALGRFIGLTANGLTGLARGGFNALSGALKGTIGRLTGFFRGIVRIAKYRAIRAAIRAITDGLKTGVENMYLWSQAVGTTFAPTMDRLATSMLYLKNGFGSMFSPLIEYFTPLIEALVDKLVDAFNWVQKLFAQLTGKSYWTRAVKVQTQYKESTQDTAKSVKALRQELQLMDFDELNNITENADTGSGGSAAEALNPNPAEMFRLEKSDLEPMEGTLWENIKKKLQEWLSKVGLWDEDGFNWTALGGMVGREIKKAWNRFTGWFNGIRWKEIFGAITSFFDGLLKELLPERFFKEDGSFNWKELWNTISGVATNIWNKIRDFWEGINWDNILSTVVKALNSAASLAINAIDGLLDRLGLPDWITDGQINWKTIGSDIVSGIVGWFEGLDIGGTLETISGSMDTLIHKVFPDEFFNWDGSFNWNKLGETVGEELVKIWNTITTSMDKIPWDMIFGGLISFLDSVLDGMGLDNWIQNGEIKFYNIGETLGTKVRTWIESVDWDAVLRTIIGILNEIVHFVDGILDGLFPNRQLRKETVEASNRAQETLLNTPPSIPQKIAEGHGEESDYQMWYNDLSSQVDQLTYDRLALKAKLKEIESGLDEEGLKRYDEIYRRYINGDEIAEKEVLADNALLAYSTARDTIEDLNERIKQLQELQEGAAREYLMPGYGSRVEQYGGTARAALSKAPSLYNIFGKYKEYREVAEKALAEYMATIDWKAGETAAYEEIKQALLVADLPEIAAEEGALSAEKYLEQYAKDVLRGFDRGDIKDAIRDSSLTWQYTADAIFAADEFLNGVDWTELGSLTVEDIKEGMDLAHLPEWDQEIAAKAIRKMLDEKWEEAGVQMGTETGNGFGTGLASAWKSAWARITGGFGSKDIRLSIGGSGKKFASGGYPAQGTMFLAGEVPGQAEMIGNINGRTGVVGGREISGIGDAVWSTGGTTASLLSELISVLRSKEFTVSPSASLGKVVQRSQRLYATQTG